MILCFNFFHKLTNYWYWSCEQSKQKHKGAPFESHLECRGSGATGGGGGVPGASYPTAQMRSGSGPLGVGAGGCTCSFSLSLVRMMAVRMSGRASLGRLSKRRLSLATAGMDMSNMSTSYKGQAHASEILHCFALKKLDCHMNSMSGPHSLFLKDH